MKRYPFEAIPCYGSPLSFPDICWHRECRLKTFFDLGTIFRFVHFLFLTMFENSKHVDLHTRQIHQCEYFLSPVAASLHDSLDRLYIQYVFIYGVRSTAGDPLQGTNRIDKARKYIFSAASQAAVPPPRKSVLWSWCVLQSACWCRRGV